MAFDGITIANIVKDLQDNLIDGRLSKIAQPEPDELLCTIKGKNGQQRLCLSASASLEFLEGKELPGVAAADDKE